MSSPSTISGAHERTPALAEAAPLRLCLWVDGPTARGWHLDLLRRLGTCPDIAATIRHAGGAAAPADLILDLCGDAPETSGRVWRLTFDGAPGEAALLASLAAGRTPVAAITEVGRTVACGRLGTESSGNARGALDDMLARTTTLILAALAGGARALPDLPEDDTGPGAPEAPSRPAIALRAGRRMVRSAIRRAYRLCYHTPHWRVGWRRLDEPDVFALRDHPASGWQTLPDDGSRFYADPFPIEHDGRVTLFVEEFPHATGKGVISAVEFGPHGPLGRPEPVLELPTHLSYPFVFARDGAMWMIPESGATGTVDLFRATAFPGGWVRETTLISGIVASDATLVEHEGRWWMFATARDGGGAFSDALHLWSAPDFRGPWTAHRRNPVLIDIASARPAGRIVSRDGALLRPAQDCRRGYGAALGIARIDRLDDDGFAQTVETILTAGPRWPGRRLHTLNSAGGFEFIDGGARAPRRWWQPQPPRLANT